MTQKKLENEAGRQAMSQFLKLTALQTALTLPILVWHASQVGPGRTVTAMA